MEGFLVIVAFVLGMASGSWLTFRRERGLPPLPGRLFGESGSVVTGLADEDDKPRDGSRDLI